MDNEDFSLFSYVDSFRVRVIERRSRSKIIDLYRDYWGEKSQALV